MDKRFSLRAGQLGLSMASWRLVEGLAMVVWVGRGRCISLSRSLPPSSALPDEDEKAFHVENHQATWRELLRKATERIGRFLSTDDRFKGVLKFLVLAFCPHGSNTCNDNSNVLWISKFAVYKATVMLAASR